MIRASRPKGYRLVETRRGDTLQDVAARELGDAGRWPDIVAINGLASPFIVDDLAGLEFAPAGRVALAGQAIKVPAPPRGRPSAVAADDIHGTDMLLGADGALGIGDDGDWATVSGPKNLAQALRNRLRTRLRELNWHPSYGNGVFRLLGRGGNGARGMLAAVLVARAIKADPRVAQAKDVRADVTGDDLRCSGVAVATDGKPLPIAIGSEGE